MTAPPSCWLASTAASVTSSPCCLMPVNGRSSTAFPLTSITTPPMSNPKEKTGAAVTWSLNVAAWTPVKRPVS